MHINNRVIFVELLLCLCTANGMTRRCLQPRMYRAPCEVEQYACCDGLRSAHDKNHTTLAHVHASFHGGASIWARPCALECAELEFVESVDSNCALTAGFVLTVACDRQRASSSAASADGCHRPLCPQTAVKVLMNPTSVPLSYSSFPLSMELEIET